MPLGSPGNRLLLYRSADVATRLAVPCALMQQLQQQQQHIFVVSLLVWGEGREF
jgi:hypothetical protein